MHKFRRLLKDQSGVTLIEMLAVGVIIAILAAIAVPAAGMAIDKMKVRSATDTLNKMREALERYKVDAVTVTANHTYPQTTVTTDPDFQTALFVNGTSHWSTPGNPNYAFNAYTSAAATAFQLCVRALDSDGTWVYTNQTGVVTAVVSATAPAGSGCQ
jgi:prepilin-type N-terminal cleavage/methylation domain-containing protein